MDKLEVAARAQKIYVVQKKIDKSISAKRILIKSMAGRLGGVMISLEQTRTLAGGLLVRRDPLKNVCLPVKNRLMQLAVNITLPPISALCTLKTSVEAVGILHTFVMCFQAGRLDGVMISLEQT